MPLLGVFVPRFMGPGSIVLAIIGMVSYFLQYKNWPAFSREAFFWALAIGGLLAASALGSSAPLFTAYKAFTTLPLLLAVATLVSLSKNLEEAGRQNFARWFIPAVLAAGLVCVIDIYGHGLMYFLFHVHAGRFNASVFNRGSLVFLLAAFTALYSLWHGREARRNTKFLVSAIFSVILLLVAVRTESQSFQLALLLALLTALVVPYRFKSTYTLLSLFLAVALLVTPWVAQEMYTYSAQTLSSISWLKSAYIGPRLEIWDFVARRALERPLTGFGMEATRLITDFDSARLYFPGTKVLHPHNFALQLWIEFGVWGPLLAAGLFAFLLEKIRNSGSKDARFLLPILIATISIASTSYGLWQNWWLGTFGFLLAWNTIILKTSAANKDLPSC